MVLSQSQEEEPEGRLMITLQGGLYPGAVVVLVVLVVVVPGSFAVVRLVNQEAAPTLYEGEGVVKVVGHWPSAWYCTDVWHQSCCESTQKVVALV